MSCEQNEPLVRLSLTELKIDDVKPSHCDNVCSKVYEYIKSDAPDMVERQYAFCKCKLTPSEGRRQEEL
jgi:hypothetical protein